MRKTFLAIILTAFPFLWLCAAHPAEFRAVKITSVDSDVLYSDRTIAEAMDYLHSIGINVVIPVVWNPALTLYPSAVMDSLTDIAINPKFEGRDPLQRIVIEAHRNGMEVLPWFEYGFAASHRAYDNLPTYQTLMDQNPGWLTRDNDGNVVVVNDFYWFSGIHPEVRQLMYDLVREILSNYDVDGIEFSDRIPAMPYQGGYDLVTKDIYASEHEGVQPPLDPSDEDWMQWRADKLSDFFREVRTIVKNQSEHLMVSSSPSVYPWSFNNYLQDSKTWLQARIADNVIPQVYRYSYPNYSKQLGYSLDNFPGQEHLVFSGMLIKVGDYLIDADTLVQEIRLNRSRDVMGEAFFFYEGLRENNNRLGNALRESVYSEKAPLPYREDNRWRPPAQIADGQDGAVHYLSENWQIIENGGYQNRYRCTDASEVDSVRFRFKVRWPAWYDLYIHIPYQHGLTLGSGQYTVYDTDTTYSILQSQEKLQGWAKLSSIYLKPGDQNVLMLDDESLEESRYLIADAAMLMINRRLSPDVIIPTGIEANKRLSQTDAGTLVLQSNYPNPFNNHTTIRYELPSASDVSLDLYDVRGRRIRSIDRGHCSAGRHDVILKTDGLASGVYLYRLRAGELSATGKCLLIK